MKNIINKLMFALLLSFVLLACKKTETTETPVTPTPGLQKLPIPTILQMALVVIGCIT